MSLDPLLSPPQSPRLSPRLSPAVFTLAPSGGTLIVPLSANDPQELCLRAPGPATRLELRGIARDPDVVMNTPVTTTGARLLSSDFLPLTGGFWLRLHLRAQDTKEATKEQAEEEAEALVLLTLPPAPALRFVLIRAPEVATGPAGPCFASCATTLPIPAPRAATLPDTQPGLATTLATLMRTGSATDTQNALEALARLPHAAHDKVVKDLLGALADDPGQDPSSLLPVLMLLAKG